MSTLRQTADNSYWNTLRRNQGQIVSHCYPQLNGAAEQAGPLPDLLALVDDASDGDWWLEARAKPRGEWETIRRGNRFAGQNCPSVAEAEIIRQEHFAAIAAKR